MEKSLIMDRFPVLRELDHQRQAEFKDYFRTAPDWLLDSCTLQEMEKGTTFIKEGDPASVVFFIVRGVIKATDYRIYGIAYDFKLFWKMYAFGGMEVIVHLDRYQATLKTVTPCTVLRVPSQAFRRWVESDLEALRRESQMMGEYLLETARENRALLFLQGADRLGLLLVTRYQRCAHNGVLKLSRDRQELADATGLCLKTISRSVKKFRQADMLTVQGDSILVSREQYERLQAMVSEVLAEDF